jgi:hypothetical protein
VLVAVVTALVAFSLLFDYFGRPALVIDGLFNEHQLMNPNLTSYSLGSPTWGFGTVSYPLTGRTATESCEGSIQLSWNWFGWNESTSQILCRPS